MNMPQKQQTEENPEKLLEQIKADIISDNVCPDLAQTATQLVMGHGSSSAKIVFIGEAPGKNEDLQGIPFVGAAGKLLDEMLAENSVSRSDVYITNIVKYRPPNNRDPFPDEKREFWPYLLRELKVIGPSVIVTLGRHSMEYFLPEKRIAQVHGKPHRVMVRVDLAMASEDHDEDGFQGVGEKRTESYKSTAKGTPKAATQKDVSNLSGVARSPREQGEMVMVLLPLYHPAAALYNGGLRQTLFEDFKTIKNYIN